MLNDRLKKNGSAIFFTGGIEITHVGGRAVLKLTTKKHNNNQKPSGRAAPSYGIS